MDNLHLIDDDGYLIRAAMLAFYKDPEKWVTGSYIKIGYFGKSDSDLVYQDEVHGPLIEQVDKTVDLVYTKYMKALIDYEGIQRVEQFMFHKDAFREILLNAVVHKDYSSCNPIQISVYEDKDAQDIDCEEEVEGASRKGAFCCPALFSGFLL